MTGIWKYRRDWAALATLALLLHALFAGFADGAMAAPGFEGVLCSQHADARAPSLPGKTDDGHARHRECCLAGCGAAGGKVLPAPSAPLFAVAPPEVESEQAPIAGLARRPERSPLNPRGPPTDA